MLPKTNVKIDSKFKKPKGNPPTKGKLRDDIKDTKGTVRTSQKDST